MKARPRKYGRRQFERPHSEEGAREGIYRLESLTALAEFARYRPEAIKAVYCHQRLETKVREKLPALEARLKILPASQAASTGEETAALWGEVSIPLLPEPQFASRRALRDKDLLLCLDHITDPRNLGAIARSAAFFGVSELIIARDRQVGLTSAAVATAQGAFALTDLVQVVNLARTLEQLKKEGYWIIGAEAGGGPIEAIAPRFAKVVLVLGAEDQGLSPLIKRSCDAFVGIGGAEKRLDSLNVSVAAGILLRGFFQAQNLSVSDFRS